VPILCPEEKKQMHMLFAKRTLDIPLLEPHLYSEDEYKEMEGIIDKMSDGGILIQSEKPPTSQ
jgi:hypothetical protein